MNEEKATVLVVEDERGMRDTLVGSLEDLGFNMVAYASGNEAMSAIRESAPDVVISDLRLPDADGLEILQTLKEVGPESAFIVVTGYASVDTAIEAVNKGAYAYITKPFNMEEVYSTVRNAAEQQRLMRENRRLVASLQKANKGLNAEVEQRTRAEEALQNSLERMKTAYDQATIYAQELREEIAQRERAEEALTRAEELRRLLAAQEAKEQERKRLAEELHDETMAELASVVVDLGFLSKYAGPLPPKVETGLAELRGRVRNQPALRHRPFGPPVEFRLPHPGYPHPCSYSRAPEPSCECQYLDAIGGSLPDYREGDTEAVHGQVWQRAVR